MAHSHAHARHHRTHHRHRAHPNAEKVAAGVAGGAAFAGAGTLGAQFFGQQQTREFAEAAFEKMPKNMVSGLAVGFMVGGATGAYLMHQHEGHAARVFEERERSGGRGR